MRVRLGMKDKMRFRRPVISKPASRSLALLTGAILCLGDLRSDANVIKARGSRRLRVAVTAETDLGRVDPARPRGALSRILARNLYGRLLEYDDDGEVIPGLASGFEWRGRALVLSFAGPELTAADAAHSLKRTLIVLRAAGDRSAEVLCAENSPQTPDDACEDIRIEGDELILNPRSDEHRARLVATLARTDFGVVPRRAFATAGPRFEIVDPTLTSGRYRRLAWDAPNVTRLVATGRADDDAPAVIELVETSPARAAAALQRGDVEVLAPALTRDGASVAAWVRANPRVRVVDGESALGRSSARLIVHRRWRAVLTPDAADLELWKIRWIR